MFLYKLPIHPLAADLIRHVGYLSFEVSALFAQGVNPRSTVAELADLAMAFHLGAMA